MQPKKTYLIVFGFIILLIIVFLFLYLRQTKITAELLNKDNNNSNRNLPSLEFLTDSEKAEFSLPADAKAQILGRDESGAVSVYKIIRSEADLVDTSLEVESISPRRGQVESQKLPE